MNKEIKEKIKRAGLHQYQVADLCGVCETTMVRWLRYKLTPDKEKMIIEAIKKGSEMIETQKGGE